MNDTATFWQTVGENRAFICCQQFAKVLLYRSHPPLLSLPTQVTCESRLKEMLAATENGRFLLKTP